MKWIHFSNDRLGTRFGLSYYRDRDKHEVDFVVTDGLHPQVLIEAKLSDMDTHSGLMYLKKRLPEAEAFQVIGADVKSQEKNGVKKIGVEGICGRFRGKKCNSDESPLTNQSH